MAETKTLNELYGELEEEKKKNWFDMILDYMKTKKETAQPKLQEVA